MKHLRKFFIPALLCLLVLAGAVTASAVQAGVVTMSNGSVRVELLSDTVIRVEEKVNGGFEDRISLVAVGRDDFSGVEATVSETSAAITAKTANYTVKLYKNRTTLASDAVEVTDRDGKLVWKYSYDNDDTVPIHGFYTMLPDPNDTPAVFALADAPRVIPAAKGAADAGSTDDYSGWELTLAYNQYKDVYLFLTDSSAMQLRSDIVALTGRAPVSNIKTFGSWYSRYQDWSDKEYLAVIENYRKNGFPLDVLTIDTNWRASKDGTGYDLNTTSFPDMQGFLTKAKAAGVLTIFNDHVHKTNRQALDPVELKFFTENLQNILKLGLDGWWYDRNWSYNFNSPYQGIVASTFGKVVYNDILKDYAGDKRVFLMANAEWVKNGKINYRPSIIGHRYGIQWSGDITSEALQLRRELTNMVSMTAAGASPYMSSDLGGFMRATQQSNAMYTRWMQYGALSPIFRIHSSSDYSKEINKLPYSSRYTAATQTIVRNYMNMRYNLLPLFYTLGHEAYETGLPITRRLDFYYDTPEAADNTEYLLGDSLLVAPLWTAYGEGDDVVPASWFPEGLTVSYYNTTTMSSAGVMSGSPVATAKVSNIDFDWGDDAPASGVNADNFSAVFEGKFTPAEDCYIGGVVDDGMRLWVDGKLVVNKWTGGWLVSYMDMSNLLKAGTTYTLKFAFHEGSGGAVCSMVYAHVTDKGVTARDVYIPEGDWIDLFTGKLYDKAGTYRVYNGIETSPVFARVGAVLPAIKVVSPMTGADFKALSLNVFAGGDGSYTLYEDDGETLRYQSGKVRETAFTHTANATGGMLEIAAATGDFTTDYTSRTYTVRVHGTKPVAKAVLDGKTVSVTKIAKRASALPFAETGAAPDSDVYEITFDASLASAHTLTWSSINTVLGDANGDGTVTVLDALHALCAILGGTSADRMPAADMDGDGTLTLADVVQILRAVSLVR